MKLSFPLAIAVASLVLVPPLDALANSAAAALPQPGGRALASKSGGDEPGWKWQLDASLEGGYDSNVFRLSDRTIDRLERDRASDQVSGRFDDMSDVNDFILTGNVELAVRGDGFRGRRLKAWLGVGYDQALLNSILSHPRFEAGLSQRLGGDREASLEVSYAMNRFRRNYLSGTEPNPGPQISASERRYSSGTFDDVEILTRYEKALWKRSKKRSSRLKKIGVRRIDAAARLGYARRDFDHFSNRDRDTLIVGAGVAARLGKRWRVESEYELQSIFTAGKKEFLVLDEADVGVDLNNDLDAVDSNVGTFQEVDRNRTDHTVGVELTWDGPKRWVAKGGYEFMFQDYASDEAFDLSYRDRSDERHTVYAELEWGFAKRWVASLRGDWMDESSNRVRAGDEPEESSYSRYRISLGLVHRFF
jgi:hypothetical protein